MTQWSTIDAFPRYEVSDEGEVRNIGTDRILKTKMNQYGVVGVGLMKHGIQFHRSVPLLVAQAFIPRRFPAFDTPINLDGDRRNNHASNLMWRPRWHAVEYNRQFKEPYANPITSPIRDRTSFVVWSDSWQCAISNGLLEKDLVLSILNRTYAWPTYQEFETIEGL